jgi:UDP-3-O-[3-hydroxymyristoyl] glucosamine N-acyltransferase
VGIAGSADIGRYCTIAGAAKILGHLKLADHVHISVDTLVTKSILEPGTYSGSFPNAPHREYLKTAALVRNLARMEERLRELEKRLAERGGASGQ